jgi:outer membrane biosynthesis protein TonB
MPEPPVVQRARRALRNADSSSDRNRLAAALDVLKQEHGIRRDRGSFRLSQRLTPLEPLDIDVREPDPHVARVVQPMIKPKPKPKPKPKHKPKPNAKAKAKPKPKPKPKAYPTRGNHSNDTHPHHHTLCTTSTTIDHHMHVNREATVM